MASSLITATDGSSSDRAFLTLQSSNGQHFRISVKAAQRSSVLRNLIDYTAAGNHQSNPANQEKMKEVSNEQPFIVDGGGEAVSVVIAWLEHHKDSNMVEINDQFEETPAWDDFRSGQLEEWDATFLGKLDLFPTLSDVIAVAGFLDIKNLVAYASKVIASKLEGKSSDEMRQILCIDPDDGEFKASVDRSDSGMSSN